MGFIYTIVAALCVWLAMWALGVKALDSLLVAIVIMLVGVTARLLSRPEPSRS